MGQAPDPICVGHVHARAKASRGQRDGRWYWEARWQAGEGERPSRALGWLTRSEASQAAARLLLEGTAPKASTPTTGAWRISDLVDSYLGHLDTLRADRERLEVAGVVKLKGDRLPGISANTLKIYEHHLGRARARIGDLPCARLSEALLVDLYRDLQRPTAERPRGGSPKAARVAVVVLHAAWTWAWRRSYLPPDPRPVAPRGLSAAPVRRKVEPTPAQLQELLGRLEGWPRAWLALAAATGMRPGEMASLRASDLDEAAGLIRLRATPGRTKTGARVVYVAAWAWDHVRPIAAAAGPRSLWPLAHPDQGARRHLAAAVEGTALEGMTLYGLRHAAATAMRDAGAPNAISAAQLGHSEAMFVATYGSVLDESRAAWVGRVAPGSVRAEGTEGKVVAFRRGTRRGDRR